MNRALRCDEPRNPRRALLRRGLALAISVCGAAASSLTPLAARAADSEAASAAGYPRRPIRFIVPYPPGGPLDQVARALGQALQASLGQPLVIENRPGAGGNIGAEQAARATPDGYTLVMGAVATHAINPFLYRHMPYDAIRDFAPVTRLAVVPNVLIMNPQTADRLGIGSVRQLIDYAKAHPGALSYASGGNGSAGHLAGELFKSMAGIRMVHVPYPGAGPAQLGLLGGQTDLMFDNLASASPQIRAGKLRAFAVTTAARSPFFPALPTVAESGLPGFDIDTWFGVFAPAGTPSVIVDRLHQAIAAALEDARVRQVLNTMSAAAAPLTPAEFAKFVVDEQARYRVIVRQSGAHVD